MYKFKLINFKPYEYKTLQKKLNQLGKSSYKTNDLSFITIFKKTNKTFYYKIDFYIPEGNTRFDKQASKQRFFDPYLDHGYEAIYNKNNMYVFIGEEPFDYNINFHSKEEFINEKKTFKCLNAFIASIVISLTFIILLLNSMTIDTFLSYGMTFVFLGIILCCLSMIFRCFCNMYFTNQLKRKFHKTKYNLSISLLLKLRKIYGIFAIVAFLFIAGGLIEDTFNAKTFTPQKHPILLLKDLGIKQNTELLTQVNSSFTVPYTYTSLETAKDKSTLFIKEYNLKSKKAAEQLLLDFADNPQQYYCTSIKIEGTVLYGYTDNNLTSIIIQKDNQVTLISPGFTLTKQNIEHIIQFYY